MARKKKTSKSGLRDAGSRILHALAIVLRRRVVYGLLTILVLGATTMAAARGVELLRMRVDQKLLDQCAFPTVDFADLPPQLALLAQSEMEDSLVSLLDGPWTDDRLCRSMAQRLEQLGWIAAVRQVRRYNDGRFVVNCRYRVPVAMVAQGGEYYLVDDEGVRLPGVYRADATWRLIEGVSTKPPEPGKHWEGGDIAAAMRLLGKLGAEPFGHQLAAIDVENFKGRVNARSSHIVLRTHQVDGRIQWGSAPGTEIEENSMKQKLAILRENFLRTGRADAGHPFIDISTFPDRFTIPG